MHDPIEDKTTPPTALPTRLLPPLRRRDLPVEVVETVLQELSRYLDSAENDVYERDYSQQWLTRLVARACEEQDGWEGVLASASALLARLAGPSAAPASTTHFSFPLILPNSPPRALELSIHSQTLLGDSTGAVIWPAGRHLARRIASSPTTFFYLPSQPLSVLELGSGTGLVGLAAAAVLSELHIEADVILSDNDDYALENLAANISANAALINASVRVSTCKLDWRARESEERFDVLLGGDVVYDLHHADLLRNAIETHLAPNGTAHIVMSLRPTHTAELKQVDIVFTADESSKLEIKQRQTDELEGEPYRYESLWIGWK